MTQVDTDESSQEHEGTIKIFDEAKGFGFIKSASVWQVYSCDAFLHRRQLGDFQVGDIVRFTVQLNKSGKPQAADLKAAAVERSASDAQAPMRPALWLEAGFKPEPSHTQLPAPDAVSESSPSGALSSPSASPVASASSALGPALRPNGRHTGTVKSFDAEKGYGFIAPFVPDQFSGDVFLHGKYIQDFVVGDRVCFSARPCKKDPQKMQAFDLSRHREEAVEKSDRRPVHQGTIKMVDNEKGFGFILCPELYETYRSDIHVDKKHLQEFGVGDVVRFRVKFKPGEVRPTAVRLELCPDDGDVHRQDDGDRHTGTIKSFDTNHGFGFISCPEVFESFSRDVFVHTKQIKQFKPGDSVAFSLRINAKGEPQAYCLQEAPNTVAWLMPEGAEPAPRGPQIAEDEEFEGQIKSFSKHDGYGFIGCTKLHERFDRDVYLPQSEYSGLGIGDRVRFHARLRKGKPVAYDVELVERGKTCGTEARRSVGDVSKLEIVGLNRKMLRACASAKVESVDDMEHLLEAKADPDARDVTGQTALMICALNVRHSERKCRVLIFYGADPTIPARPPEDEDDGSGSDRVQMIEEHGQTVLEWTRERINAKFAAYLEALHNGEKPEVVVMLDRPPAWQDI